MSLNRVLERVSIKTLEHMLALKKRRAALAPLERRRVKLLRELKQVESKIERLTGSAPAKKAPPEKRKLSAAGRRNIIAAVKARWAKVKAQKVKHIKAAKLEAAVGA